MRLTCLPCSKPIHWHSINLLILTALWGTVSAGAQQQQAKQNPVANTAKPAPPLPPKAEAAARGPSLPETMDWIKQTLEGSGTSDSPWPGTLVTSKIISISFDGCKMTSTETLAVNDSLPGKATVSFSFKDIDPSSVKLSSGKNQIGGEQVHQFASFFTTNHAKTITRQAFSKEGKPLTVDTMSVSEFHFDNQEIGDGLVKALVHAVQLCGGQKSLF